MRLALARLAAPQLGRVRLTGAVAALRALANCGVLRPDASCATALRALANCGVLRPNASCAGGLARSPVLRSPPRQSVAPLSAAAAADTASDRLFTSYDVYKGKSALNVKPVRPTFSAASTDTSLRLQKAGGLLVEMAPASGQRTYDWASKIMFLLNVTEMGDLLAFNADVASQALQFTHDPAMNTAQAGTIIKTLRVSAMKDGASHAVAALQSSLQLCLTAPRHAQARVSFSACRSATRPAARRRRRT